MRKAWRWPYSFRTWMLITGLGPPVVLGIAWLLGWKEPLESLGPWEFWF